jgi:hypothetical protein
MSLALYLIAYPTDKPRSYHNEYDMYPHWQGLWDWARGLGEPIGTAQRVGKNAAWKREFTNGTVVLNMEDYDVRYVPMCEAKTAEITRRG